MLFFVPFLAISHVMGSKVQDMRKYNAEIFNTLSSRL